MQAVIDIGPSDFAVGLTYVALSRVRSIEDLLLEPFHRQRLVPSARATTNLELRNDFLKQLASKK